MATNSIRFYDPSLHPHTLVDILDWHVEKRPHQEGYIFLADGDKETDRYTYLQLQENAKRIAAFLQSRRMAGERILILFAPGLEYVAAFLGCLYAGAIAVPAYPPRNKRTIPRITTIVQDSEAKLALTSSDLLPKIKMLFDAIDGLKHVEVFASDSEDVPPGDAWIRPDIGAETISFLQYTSGSTGNPKGVMLSHGNLMHNLSLIRENFRINSDSAGVIWLPPYHDMGLIGGILQPLYSGTINYFMSPLTFLGWPMRWLKLISRIKDGEVISGGPNFAYELCVKKATEELVAELDLSNWVLAFSGAEPIRAASLEQFYQTFKSAGFKRSAYYPCYGLAEATLFVTGMDRSKEYSLKHYTKESLQGTSPQTCAPDFPDAQELVGCGFNLRDQDLRIINPEEFTECAPGEIGEIWVAGPSVAQGYWKNKNATEETFQAYLKDGETGPFLRTGDLGFLEEGELFITGRLKDLIIIRGANYYPQDIEFAVEKTHEALREGSVAAFSTQVNDEERLVIVQEIRNGKYDHDAIISDIRRTVSELFDLNAYAIFLIKTKTIFKTSSGKIMRRATKQAYEAGELEIIKSWCADDVVTPPPTKPHESAAESSQAPAQSAIKDKITNRIAELLNRNTADIATDVPFANYGLDSVQSVGIAAEIEDWLQRPLSPTLLWDYPSIDQLSEYLAGDEKAKVTVHHSPQRSSDRQEPVAIIGMACRFPGAANPDEFWKLLINGQSGIQEVPQDRWDVNAFYDPNVETPGKMATRWGGFIPDVDKFDPTFFSISPREATYMDPQQRLLLEVAWETFENAGQIPSALKGSHTGVFVGVTNPDYPSLQAGDYDNVDTYTSIGNALAIAANRLSYVFDFQGPSLALDTACSSSLVAAHMACKSLQSNESDMALAAGINLVLAPAVNISLSKATMLSPTGSCKTFDANADGYVRSEGVGMVLLKRLSDAIRDKDNVLAIIRGSAVNQDGRSNGITAPNRHAQERAVLSAWADANVTANDVDFVETHGTGTALGDPIEVQALATAFRERTVKAPVRLGAVKPNIGHLETAAGIAGLIKAVLALKHATIPPNINFTTLNPRIPLQDMPFSLPSDVQVWETQDKPRIAGVHSFGFGGTNAHMVLQEAPTVKVDSETNILPESVIAFGAKTEKGLRDRARRYAQFVESNEHDVADIVFSINTSQDTFEHRFAAVVQDKSRLATLLKQYAQGEKAESARVAKTKGPTAAKVAFLFSGAGAEYHQMGKTLYESQSLVKDIVDQCDEWLKPHLESSIVELLFAEKNNDTSDLVKYAQPALFVLEYALAKLWISMGVKPDVVMGHGIGEVVAATIAEALSLEDALKLVVARGRLMREVSESNAAASIAADEERVAERLKTVSDRVAIAAVNGPEHVVIAGEQQSVDEILAFFTAQNIEARRLSAAVPHSPVVDAKLAEFEQAIQDLTFHTPKLPLISNVSGTLFEEAALPDAAYWKAQIRQTVQFSKGMQSLQQLGAGVFLEIGPQADLIHMGQTCVTDTKALWLASCQKADTGQTLAASLRDVYVAGHDIDWRHYYGDWNYRRIWVPNYPFARERYWLPKPKVSASISADIKEDQHPLLGHPVRSPLLKDTVYEKQLHLKLHPILNDHVVFGASLVPATAFLDVALAAAQRALDAESVELANIEIHKALPLSENMNTMQIVVSKSQDELRSLELYSLQPELDEHENLRFLDNSWVRNVSATVNVASAENPSSSVDLDSIKANKQEFTEPQITEFYQNLKKSGLAHGASLQSIRQCWSGDSDALAWLECSESTANDAFLFHPALADGALQLLAVLLQESGSHGSHNDLYLPVAMKRFRLFQIGTTGLWAHTKRVDANEKSGILQCDVSFYDTNGSLVAEIAGVTFKHVSQDNFLFARLRDLNSWFYRIDWQEAPLLSRNGLTTGTWLVLDDGSAAVSELATALNEHSKVVSVNPGASFEQVSETEFRLNAQNEADVQSLLQSLDDVELQGVVYSSIAHSAQVDRDQPWQGQQDVVHPFLNLSKALLSSGKQPLPRLVVLTQGMQPVDHIDEFALTQAPLQGVVKTLALEHPKLGIKVVDLDAKAFDVSMLVNEIISSDDESWVAYRHAKRFVARLVHHQELESDAVQLQIEDKGVLDHLKNVPVERKAPQPGTVEIRVHATGLNFRDVLNALDLYPGDAGALGGECAGVVTAVGDGVESLSVGDAVMGIAPGSFASYVITSAELLVKKPENLTFEQAATLPITFLTAHYALNRLGKIKSGDKVLIHAASGGVGLAAVQLAQAAGAEIFGSAGNDEKRQFLKEAGVSHLLNSRSLDFAERIQEITEGRGVDLVLNSLSGDYIAKNLEILAPKGRFLEIGKAEIWTTEQVAQVRDDVHYFTIALDDLSVNEPHVIQDMLQELVPRFETGELEPLHHVVYELDHAVEAFRLLQQAKHIGKIVLRPQSVAPDREIAISPDASYLITGGRGALGLQAAEWLIAQGAKYLVLLGRSEPLSTVINRAEQLKRQDVTLLLAQGDVSNLTLEDLETTLGVAWDSIPPIKGIFHAAGVLDDGVVVQQTWERFETVMMPKVRGAWNLHLLSQSLNLDFMVYFSSAASIFGSPGQSNYGAANAFLDTLAHYRSQRGLPGLSIGWGPWEHTGMTTSKSPTTFIYGMRHIQPKDGSELFEKAMHQSRPHIGVFPMAWTSLVAQWGGQVPAFLTHVAERSDEQQGQTEPELLTLLKATAPEERFNVTNDYLSDKVSRVLGLSDQHSIDIEKPLKEMGLDSLMAVEIKKAVDLAIGRNLSATVVFNYPTIADLSNYLLSDVLQMTSEPEPKTEEDSEEPDELLADIADLSDEEAERLLLKKLSEDEEVADFD